jgi:diguanylate cyclase (GGDEF)-like protein
MAGPFPRPAESEIGSSSGGALEHVEAPEEDRPAGREHARAALGSEIERRAGKGFAERLAGRGPGFWTGATLGLALVLGALDYLAGPELALSLVYALPVAGAAWFAGFRRASAVAIVSCAVWLAVEVAQETNPSPLVTGFNACRRAAVFLGTAYLLSALKGRLDREARSARTDFLTGVGNARSFYEGAVLELARAARYGRPFTIVYADADGFKTINDRLGHLRGDAVLRTIASTMRRTLRSIDLVARLGGDEFALLLPETGLEAARATLEKLRLALQAASPEGLTVTLTMGALTCSRPPADATHMMHLADALLLSGKRLGKDMVRYAVYDGPE